jgi:class 3 adenylate cyclase/tetratricopeptide (TPR) repeat protein
MDAELEGRSENLRADRPHDGSGTGLLSSMAPSYASRVIQERKVITVLFADLVGFTSTAEQLDPEDVADILKPYHERLRYELERWGGTVEKFIGDAVMALFGAPVTREDDPERAVRAALAIRDWTVDEGTLEVRIAVNTGEALVDLAAKPEAGEGMAAGDVVNTTARMQSAAPVNGILVGEMTQRATVETIDYRKHEPVEAKGKQAPIPVWEAVQARARFRVDLAPAERTPLVGRARELDQLVDALARVREQRSSELLTLIGVPGIGKSRLVGELFRSIERSGELTFWRQGRSLPYGQGVSYWALGEMVKAQAGILETDGEEEAGAKLTRTVEQLIDDDREWVLSHLRPLVGQANSAAGSQEEAFAAWRRFWEALAEDHALVLVFEDIHWADEGLLDFIDHLADWVRDVPLFIVCTARLELLERRPAWGGGKVNASTVQLTPLSDQQTAALMSALGADAEDELVERCGGNPLYAEQFVRMLGERGEGALPETVQGIIAARLDALASEEKALLQDAAVVGKVFWLGALGATKQQLHVLRQKEFVQRARRSSVEGETEFAFKHVLVRDVAYGQIPRAERAQKHLHAAEWIESLGRAEDHAEMVAHHYVNALELARASRQDVSELERRTARALREAGERALTLNALTQAENYLRQARALAPDDPELLLRHGRVLYLQDDQGEAELAAAREGLPPEQAAEATLMLADIAWKQSRRKDMEGYLEEARSLVEDLPASRAQAAVVNEVARYETLAGRVDVGLELGFEALAMAEQLGLDDLRIRALNTLGVAHTELGDPRGEDELREVIELASKLNLVDELVRGWNNLTAVYGLRGDLERTLAGEAETIRLARHFGHQGHVRFIESAASIGNRLHAGEWDDAFARAEDAVAQLEQGLVVYSPATAYGYRGLIRVARDDAEGAHADAKRALEHARRAGDPQALNPDVANAACVFTLVGNRERADEAVTEALENLRPLRRLGFGVMESHSLAWAAHQLGREADVAEVLEREAFESVWLRAALAVAAHDFHAAAEIMAGSGFKTDAAFFRLQSGAEEDVRRALDFHRGVGATRYIREAEELLAVKA